ncbi:MAG: hypothetical protein LQ351_007333 [Letrouitia transgressa]|nr:MAG: hypothetical protein LQ351_007333 [Letrouitia transgressa]
MATSSSASTSSSSRISANGTKKDDYVLARDFKSASRLNYEHYLWHETLGFHIHPDILSFLTLPPTAPAARGGERKAEQQDQAAGRSLRLRIADLACGTALWATHVALSLPSRTGNAAVEVTGYDISLSQTPPSSWLPPNLRLEEWDIFSPALPPSWPSPANKEQEEGEEEEEKGHDVVHLRLLFVIIKRGIEDVRRVLRQALRLVKKGGWVQWDELAVGESYVFNATTAGGGGGRGGGEDGEIENMVKFLQTMGGWVGQIGSVMEDEGMEQVSVKRLEEKKELVRAFFDNHLAKDEEMALRSGDKEGLERVRRLAEEGTKGKAICTPKVVWVGRRKDGYGN